MRTVVRPLVASVVRRAVAVAVAEVHMLVMVGRRLLKLGLDPRGSLEALQGEVVGLLVPERIVESLELVDGWALAAEALEVMIWGAILI